MNPRTRLNLTGLVEGSIQRGWDPWDDRASIPPRCVNARSGWSSTTRPRIRRSGRRFDRSAKLGIRTESLRRWVPQAERDTGQRPGLTTSEREALKLLQREHFELKRANEILRRASASFAQAEFDCRPK